MFYIIYKITNIVNGKIYIGKHETENLHDGYLGSGIAIREAVRKHGKHNFEKEIMFIFDTAQEMNDKERELISEDFIKSKETYNLGVGGEGGPHFKGKTHSLESKNKMGHLGQKISDAHRKRIIESNQSRGISLETRRKIAISMLIRNGKTREEAEILASQRKKIPNTSESLRGYYKNPENRIKKSKACAKLPHIYDLEEMKKEWASGIPRKELLRKYNLSVVRYDHILRCYFKK
jgi:hypothetical protein